MIQMTVGPSDPTLYKLIAVFKHAAKKEFPSTEKAFGMAAQLVQYTWKQFAMGAGGHIKNPSGNYAKSIQTSQKGAFRYTVFSDSDYAEVIEYGAPEIDLKKTLPYGPKSRMGQNGPYLIVPIRHGTPDSRTNPMPSQMYQQIRSRMNTMTEGGRPAFEKSTVGKETYNSANAHGQMVQRHTYKWGNRVYNSPFSNMEGMVAFDVPSGGQEKRTSYVTFRVVSANPPKHSKAQQGWDKSWVVPAREGKHITEKVVEYSQEMVKDMIKKGIEQDLEA